MTRFGPNPSQVIAIDPGMTSGLVWGHFDGTTPFIRDGFKELPGGLEAMQDFLADWVREHGDPGHVVVERFKPRPMARNYRLDELEPLRIEGLVYQRWLHLTWQWPEQRGWGKNGVKTAEQALRATNLWLVPSDIDNHKDANDVNSAQMHLLAFMRNGGHAPTINAYLR